SRQPGRLADRTGPFWAHCPSERLRATWLARLPFDQQALPVLDNAGDYQSSCHLQGANKGHLGTGDDNGWCKRRCKQKAGPSRPGFLFVVTSWYSFCSEVGATGLEPVQAVALTSFQFGTSSNNLCCSLALYSRAMWRRVAPVLYGMVQHGGTIEAPMRHRSLSLSYVVSGLTPSSRPERRISSSV